MSALGSLSAAIDNVMALNALAPRHFSGHYARQARVDNRLRWRLALRALRENLTTRAQGEAGIRPAYRHFNDFWADALREPISAYDFSDLLAVLRASTERIRSERPQLFVLRQQVFDALQEAARVAVPWFIGEKPPLIDSQREEDVAAQMMKVRLVPWETAVWLLHNPKTASLLPDSLCRYLSSTVRSTWARTFPVVTISELSAFMTQPQIRTLKRHQQWEAVREHFQPRWVPRHQFRRAAAVEPRPAGRY